MKVDSEARETHRWKPPSPERASQQQKRKPNGGALAAASPGDASAGAEGGVVGPLSLSALRVYFAWNLIDGLTYVLRLGASEWTPICDYPDYDFLVATAADGSGGGVGGDGRSSLQDETLVLAAVAAAVKGSCSAGKGQKTPAASGEGVAAGDARGDASLGGFPPSARREKEALAGGVAAAENSQQALSPEELEALRKKLENAEKRRAYRDRRKRKRDEGLFVQPKKNPNIYVSGLPLTYTEKDVADLFKKAGVFKVDPETLQPKIRLYTDEAGLFKGDCLISFAHEASVETAIRYFDQYAVDEAHTIQARLTRLLHAQQCTRRKESSGAVGGGVCRLLRVSLADFSKKQEQKTEASSQQTARVSLVQQAALRRRRKRILAARQEQARLLSWDTEAADGRSRRNIVVLRPMYSLQEAEEHEEGAEFYEDLRLEILEEIAKVRHPDKITVIPRHPQGVVCVKFKQTEDAEAVIEKMRGRVFDGRVVEAFFFDGTTDFRASCLPSQHKQEAPAVRGDATAAVGEGAAEAIGASGKVGGGRSPLAAADAVEEENLEKFGSLQKRLCLPTLSLPNDCLLYLCRSLLLIPPLGASHTQRLPPCALLQEWVEEQSSDEEFSVQTEE
ncbi:RNA recognition motif-containing protein [Cyclospora cayetanensis]|uniref:RNA recognition motif-containing protein n=1 Tax=Cyclospora cayetanensis TaxID=88456 RepID=A0A1D3D2K0_9EIME|nr:RNA recognition motif-containing protein [Cyclospora cayetanensis]